MFNAINHFMEVPVQFNNSVSSCYYSATEIYTVYALYNNAAHDMQNIKFNLFFNAGLIMSSVKNIWYYYGKRELTRVNDTMRYGNELGQIAFYMLYPYEVRLNE